MKPTFAVVIWEDAMMAGHWQEGQVPEHEGPCLVYSIGWLIQSSKEKVVLVQSLTDGAHGNALTIPRGMVRVISKAVLD